MCLTRHPKAHPWGWALGFGYGIGQFWQQPQLGGVASTVGGGGRRRATRSRTVSVGQPAVVVPLTVAAGPVPAAVTAATVTL